jgi:hypothetical protein
MADLCKRRAQAPRLDASGHVVDCEPITPINDWAIMPEPMSGCWLWLATVGENGYGQITCIRDGRYINKKAHRIVYESNRGAIPDGMDLDHLCRTRSCVNPDHLEPVTRSQNVKRGLVPALTRERAARRTHCPQGHPLSGENLKMDTRGTRQCRVCTKESKRAYEARQKLPSVLEEV